MMHKITHIIILLTTCVCLFQAKVPCSANNEISVSLQGKGIVSSPSSIESHYESPATAQIIINWTSTPISAQDLRNTLSSAFGSYLMGITVTSIPGNKTSIMLQVSVGAQESLTFSLVDCSYNAYFKYYFERPEDYITRSSNWIRTRTITGTGSMDYYYDTAYYDALGLVEQKVSVAASPAGNSIIVPIFRDSLFRIDTRTYCPYATANGSGKMVTSPFASSRYQTLYGANDANYPYQEKVYDGYASARSTETMLPGMVFRSQNKHETISYGSNTSTNLVRLMRLSANGNTLTVNNSYSSNSLFRETRTTADGSRHDTYKDNDGKVVLERDWTGDSLYADTYYIYDVNSRLAWIMSPEGSSLLTSATSVGVDSDFVKKWVTVYSYDTRGRMIGRRLPGRDWEYMVYDKGGRMVLQQDHALRINDRWIYHIYDNVGNEINRTLVSSSLSQSSIQDLYDVDSFDNTYPALGGCVDWRVPISNTQFSFVQELETVRYGCDHYRTGTTSSASAKFTIPTALGFSSVSGIVSSLDRDTTTRGMKIYEKEAILGTNSSTILGRTYIERAFYYDKKGRLIQTVERNTLGGISRTSVKYDYQGRPLIVDERHKTSSSDTSNDIKLTEYTYDHRGRVLSETVTLNGGTSATVNYDYDEVGRLIGTNYGNNVSDIRSYTTQGWLKGLTAMSTQSTDPLITLNYDYWDATNATPLYDGKISELHWNNVGGTTKTYAFSYDRMGRLTSAIQPGSQSLAVSGISYNRNGNILALTRKSSAGSTLNALSYTYNGNILTSVTDSGATYSYSHDYDGRLISDGHQNLAVTYNLINLPDRVTNAGNTSQERGAFLYLADGTKVGAFSKAGTTYAGYVSLGSLTYEKYASVTTLESTDFAAGRIQASSSGVGTDVRYYTRDHLGSTRLITDATGAVLERSDYYPYGLRMEGGTQATDNRWRFSGKEEQGLIASLNWLDFGARMYDPFLGRWTTQDPLAEKYPGISPYSYCAGNPVNFVDPDGKDWKDRLIGYLMGLATNVIPFSGSLRDYYSPKDPNDYNDALMQADVAALLVGGGMVAGGQAGVGAGTTIAVTGLTSSSSVVLAPEGVIVAGAGAVVVTGSEALSLAGLYLSAKAESNSEKGYNYKGKGTSTPSTTVWRGENGERIDVENYSNREGNIHYHDGKGAKYYYKNGVFYSKNSRTGKYDSPAPPKIQRVLEKKGAKNGVKKGERYLGY